MGTDSETSSTALSALGDWCGKGRPGTLETEEECTAHRKGEGLRAHAELLKWGNIPESELCGV